MTDLQSSELMSVWWRNQLGSKHFTLLLAARVGNGDLVDVLMEFVKEVLPFAIIDRREAAATTVVRSVSNGNIATQGAGGATKVFMGKSLGAMPMVCLKIFWGSL